MRSLRQRLHPSHIRSTQLRKEFSFSFSKIEVKLTRRVDGWTGRKQTGIPTGGCRGEILSCDHGDRAQCHNKLKKRSHTAGLQQLAAKIQPTMPTSPLRAALASYAATRAFVGLCIPLEGPRDRRRKPTEYEINTQRLPRDGQRGTVMTACMVPVDEESCRLQSFAWQSAESFEKRYGEKARRSGSGKGRCCP